MLNDHGIAYIPSSAVVNEVKSGTLVRVLSDWTLYERAVFGICKRSLPIAKSSGIRRICQSEVSVHRSVKSFKPEEGSDALAKGSTAGAAPL